MVIFVKCYYSKFIMKKQTIYPIKNFPTFVLINNSRCRWRKHGRTPAAPAGWGG
jgi:hypothetical protein